MNDTAIVDNWLAHLAARAGLDGLQLDERGCAALRYQDDLELLMELPEHSPVLQLYAPVLALEEAGVQDGPQAAGLLRRLLALNLFALQTRGGAFALDERNERVVLQYQVPLDGTDAAQFERLFGNFAEAALHWKRVLAGGGATGGDADDAAPRAPAPPDPFLMRV